MCSIFMKFGTQKKLNMLIINILIGIDHLDPKLQICKIWYKNPKCTPIFMKFGKQMERANYEYSTWN